MQIKITKYLLITLVLSLGFGQLLRFEIYGLPIYLHDILILAILVTNCAGNKVRNFVLHPGLKFFLLGLGIGWLNALFHYQPVELLIPSLYTFRLLAYLALFTIVRNSRFILHTSYFIFSGLISLSIGLLQYFTLPDMRWAQYLGWDDHLNRLTLPHFDPTYTAVMLALMLFSQIYSKYIIHYSLFIIPALLLTYSRSIWLSIIATLILTLKNRLVLYLLVVGLILGVSILPRRFGEGTNLLRTYSITSRLQSDIGYIQKYKWDLIIGRGLNTLILDHEDLILPNHATSPNNSYLYIFLTTGLIGLVGWGRFMFSLYTQSASKPMLIFFFIASLFNNVMFYPFALLWVLILEARAPTSA